MKRIVSRLLTGDISVQGKTFVLCEHNFLFILKILRGSQKAETLPGDRDNISPYEQNKITSLGEMFSR